MTTRDETIARLTEKAERAVCSQEMPFWREWLEIINELDAENKNFRDLLERCANGIEQMVTTYPQIQSEADWEMLAEIKQALSGQEG